MRYILLIYDEEKKWASMSQAEAGALMGEFFAFTESIKKSGHYVTGAPLEPTHTATTVRVQNGAIKSTDGPFAETREQLGGFYIIEAKDLDEAIAIGARIPSARFGSIEVRPVRGIPAQNANAAQAAATASA